MKESINNAYNNLLNNKSLDSTEFEVDNINTSTTYIGDDKTDNNNIKKRQKTKNQKENKKYHAKDMSHEKSESKQNVTDLNYIDILICNAAYVSTDEHSKLQMYDLLYTVNTNIYGNIDFISRTLLHMKKTKKGGVILFINSEGTLYPIYGYSYYLMSKSCMWTYTHILDQELKYYNIHIANAFLPSLETPGYVIENLKKPQITKNIENLTTTLNSDYAANKVINKIKQGNKFITLNFNGYMLSVLHSGYRNPDSYFDYLIYVTFCNIFVFISSIYKIYIEYIIKSKITTGFT
uniref:3-ketodihydrosphingosine reductase n=1 Tax=Piliocolobus tephrosceles TaxID=591936 RepID=A0A8C9GIP2_9PRIM